MRKRPAVTAFSVSSLAVAHFFELSLHSDRRGLRIDMMQLH